MSIGNGRATGANSPELRVEDLSVAVATPAGRLNAVSGVSFSVDPGETLCLVGESGCGKTLTALSILGLLPANASVSARAITFRGRDLRMLNARALADLRGDRIAMIFQDPMTALNPVYTIGNQLIETYQRHRGDSARAAWARAEYLLERCGVSQPGVRLRQYPHELSGGLRQRMMIAMALMCEPTLIIADEPTTALDVTIQAQIMALLKDLQREFGMALVLITHDLGVVAQVADRVAVMYAGEIVETGTVFDVFAEPLHPYTSGLLACVPSGSSRRNPSLGHNSRTRADHDRCQTRVLVPQPVCLCDCGLARKATASLLKLARRAVDVRCIRSAELSAPTHVTALRDEPRRPEAGRNRRSWSVAVSKRPSRSAASLRKSQPIRAVDGVELDVHRGEVLAIVGESGSGKTTLGRMLLGLMQPSGGSILLNNKPLTELDPRDIARKVQPVFQDPFASLNPRKTVAQIIAFPLSVQGIGSRAERRDRVTEISQRVGLARRLLNSYPIQMSGGQRQRVAIARALVVQPDLVILDEPTSALDVSIQAQILNLLQDLQERLSLTYVFISHDMGVVRYLADRVAVMYRGRIVEMGPVERIFAAPQHEYTKSLLGAVLRPDPSGRASDQDARAEDAIR